MEIDRTPVDLALLIKESIEANSGYGIETGCKLCLPGASTNPFLIMGDTSRLMQVFANLLSNAAKFSRKGGEVVVDLTRHKDGKGVRISVIDNGVGIPDHALATIFDKFTQVDSSSERSKEGSGLGLGIAKKLVELHGGTIELKSEEGVGTTFYVDFSTIG